MGHVNSIVQMMASSQERRGLVLGVFSEDQAKVTLTKAAQFSQADKLVNLVHISGLSSKKGKSQVFFGIHEDYAGVAVVNLGKTSVGYNEAEEIEEGRENIRIAVAAGVSQLRDADIKSVDIDPCGDPEAAAEGAFLVLHSYDELKSKDNKKPQVNLNLLPSSAEDSSVRAAWHRGSILAEGQNLARRLMETPANKLTPTRFAEVAQETVGKLHNCKVTPRDKAWAEDKKMGCFLSVSQGSTELPVFLEIEYSGGPEGQAPLALVGKGVTFDSGGISIKPSADMDAMRADMGGAACVLSSIYTAAKLGIPINIIGLMPLCENLPSGTATKPGDVFRAMNGKTVQVDNTDAEGRLILADALCYAETFKPSAILDLATLTGAVVVALGSGCTGVYSTSTSLFQLLQKAGSRTGDRVWRMPLWKHYNKSMTDCQLADVNNIGSAGRMGGSCTAAGFLWEFVTHKQWMHLDIAGVMSNKSDISYLCKGMAGRPTRTLVEFLAQMSKK